MAAAAQLRRRRTTQDRMVDVWCKKGPMASLLLQPCCTRRAVLCRSRVKGIACVSALATLTSSRPVLPYPRTPSRPTNVKVYSTAPQQQVLSKPSLQKAPASNVWLIVGLGNPGENYANTRHNVGFMVIDYLARYESIDTRKLEKSAAVGKGAICGKQVILAKPVTFMNNSGESVAALSKFYKIPSSQVLVISDDLDLPVATLRLRASGGHGGHNGLRSIIQRLGNTQEFPRLKIGIGRPSNNKLPVADYVLQNFNRSDLQLIEEAVAEAAAVVRAVLEHGMEKALSGVR